MADSERRIGGEPENPNPRSLQQHAGHIEEFREEMLYRFDRLTNQIIKGFREARSEAVNQFAPVVENATSTDRTHKFGFASLGVSGSLPAYSQ